MSNVTSHFKWQMVVGMIIATSVMLAFLGTSAASAQIQDPPETDTSATVQVLHLGFFDKLKLGPGLATYMGSLDGNPQNDPFHFAARVNPSFFISGSRNLGSGLVGGADISYERLAGSREQRVQGENKLFSFRNNLLSLNALIGYEPEFTRGYFKLFAGGGPTLLLAPRYDFSGVTDEDTSDAFGRLRPDLGTRLVFNLTGGIVLFDQIRIGYRMPTTKYVDGWEGHVGGDTVSEYDQHMYVQFGFKIEQLQEAFDAVFR